MQKILSGTGILLMLASPLVITISSGQYIKNEVDVIETIRVQNVFNYIKSNKNQLPSNVDKPKPFILEIKNNDGMHIVQVKFTNWKSNDVEGKIAYTLELASSNEHKEIKGVLTDYLTQDMYNTKNFIEGLEITDIDGLPVPDDTKIPSNIPMPSLHYRKDSNVKVSVIEWDQQNSLGLVSYELKVSKEGFSKTLFGEIPYKSQGQHNQYLTELESFTHLSFKNFPLSNYIITTDSFQELDKNKLELRNGVGDIDVKSINWIKDKSKGEVSWEMEISHKDIKINGTRKITGVIDGFMTEAKEASKKLINVMTLSQLNITGLPIGDQTKLPSNIGLPIISATQAVNTTLKLWEPHDSTGEIEYQVEIEKMGFKKIFTSRIPGFLKTKGNKGLILLDTIHPEALIDFPSPNSNVLPSEIPFPKTLTSPIDGVEALVTNWSQDDFSGNINWEVQLNNNGQTKNIKGTIKGYAYIGWGTIGTYNQIPKDIRRIRGILDATIEGDFIIPKNVEKIEPWFLSGSTIQGKITIPNKFFETEYSMFRRIKYAQSIDLSTNYKMKQIQNQTFSNSKIGSLKLPLSIEIIKSNAFNDTSLGEFTLANLYHLTKIENRAFQRTVISSGFALPSHKIELGANAFLGVEFQDGFKIPYNYDPTQVANAFDHLPVNGYWIFKGRSISIPVPGSIFNHV